MKKREVLKLPVLGIDKRLKGKVLRAQLKDGILCFDCYSNGEYIGRHLLDTKNGEFGSWRDEKWREERFQTLFGYDWWYDLMNVRFQKKEEEQLTDDHTVGMYPKMPVLRKVEHMEEGYRSMKRERAEKRKRNRIDAMMDMVPVLPDDFEEWCKGIMGVQEVMFYDKKMDCWNCTACGKTHTFKKRPKHNEIRICSRTQKEVTAKTRQIRILKKERIMVLQNINEGWSVARHLAVEVEQWEGNTEFRDFEEIRIMLPKKRQGIRIFYGIYNCADEFSQEWYDRNPKNKHCYMEYCYPHTQDALKGTVYEHIGIQEIARRGWKIHYNKLMINHSECRFFEYIAKAGLRRLTEEISFNMSAWGGYFPGVKITGENMQEVLMIDGQQFFRLKQNDGGILYLKWLQEVKKIQEETIRFFEKENIQPSDIRFIGDRMSPEQVCNYLKRNMKQYKESAKYVIDIWEDYISMAERLQMDIRDEIVFRTKNLLQRHDELVEVMESMNEDQEAQLMAEKFPGVNQVLKEIKEKYRYQNKDYIMSVPENIKDIMRDGRQLHHCAGSSERYYERIQNRETYILFLRKTERPLHAFYTIETEPDGTVRQKRSEFNRQPEIEKVKGFLKEWQGEIRKRLKEEDRKLADQSRQLREKEMKELETSNEKLYEILSQDLMEILETA